MFGRQKLEERILTEYTLIWNQGVQKNTIDNRKRGIQGKGKLEKEIIWLRARKIQDTIKPQKVRNNPKTGNEEIQEKQNLYKKSWIKCEESDRINTESGNLDEQNLF